MKHNGGRCVEGKLESYDKSLNIILNNAYEVKVDKDKQRKRKIGLLIVKGSQLYSINSKDGYTII